MKTEKSSSDDARGEAAEVRDARQGIMNEAVTFAREHILQGTR